MPNLKSLREVVRELIEKHPELILHDTWGNTLNIMQLEYTIEKDFNAGGTAREMVLQPIYYWGYTGKNKVSIVQVTPEEGAWTMFSESEKPWPTTVIYRKSPRKRRSSYKWP